MYHKKGNSFKINFHIHRFKFNFSDKISLQREDFWTIVSYFTNLNNDEIRVIKTGG